MEHPYRNADEAPSEWIAISCGLVRRASITCLKYDITAQKASIKLLIDGTWVDAYYDECASYPASEEESKKRQAKARAEVARLSNLIGISSVEPNRDNLTRRLLQLERTAAVAYLDSNLSEERYALEAAKVVQAERENLHYRLVVLTTPSGGMHATIQVGPSALDPK